MPRLQSRVPGRRRHGALQERISRRLSCAPRHAALSPRARAHPRAVALGQPPRAARELGGRHRRRCAGSTNGCSASIAAACRRHGPPHLRASLLEAPCAGGCRHRARSCSTTPSPTTTTRRSAMAAADVLESAGLARRRSRPTVCCGRPLISQGLLGEARQRAERNTAASVSAGRPPARAWSSSSRAACRRCARMHRRC